MLTLSQLERYWIKYGDTNEGTITSISQSNKNAIYSSGDYSTTNNAVIRKFGIDGECKWIRELGDNTNRTSSFSIDTDSFGNVYISAITYYETDRDFIVAKYNSSGVLQWKKKLDSIGGNGNSALKVSSSNYIYICGWTNQSGEGNSDMLIMKLDSSSNIIWQKTIGLSGTEESYTLTLDSNENVIIAGYNLDDIVLLKYNSSGTLQWQRKFGDVKTGTYDAEYSLGISVDSNDNIYFSGYEIEEFLSIFGTTTYRYYGIVAKYNPSGILQWQKKITTPEQFVYIQIFSIAVDSNDNLYIAGGCSINVSNTTKYPAYIAKLDTSGNVIWQRGLYRASSSTVQYALQNFAYDILIDGYGDLCICGYTNYSNDGIYNRYWPLIFKVPSDGSLGSIYGPFIYTSVSLTYSNSTYAESESTFVENTSSFTFTDSTLTDSASSCSYDNLIKIPDDGTSLIIEVEDTMPNDGLILRLDAANRNSYPGSGTTWYDLSGNGYDATLVNGPTYSNDNGGSITFDGNDDYATTPITTTYQNFTLNCFFYNTSSSKIYRNLISKISYYATELTDFPVSLSLNDSGTEITIQIASGTSYSITDPSTGSRLSASLDSLNTWYYVSATYDKQNLKLYLNGQLVASTPNTISLPNNTLRSWSIGRASIELSGGVGETQYNGNISQVSIYNRALSESEIKDVYKLRYSNGNGLTIF